MIATQLRRLLKIAYDCAILALPEKLSLEIQHFKKHREWPNLRNPKTFSEKIQARKLERSTERMTFLADKVLVKDFVRKELGAEWLIPTIFSGRSLPSRETLISHVPFVIKANHGSGWNIFIRDTEDISSDKWSKVQKTIEGWMAAKFAPKRSGYFYQQIPPQIIIEPFVSAAEFPTDYKFYVFHEKAHFVQVLTKNTAHQECAYFDTQWNRQPFTKAEHLPLPENFRAPSSLEEMTKAAEKLSKGFDFVRVDFYEVDGQPLFGEMTFTPAGGLGVFEPKEYDLKLGQLW